MFWKTYLHSANQSLDLVLDKTRTHESASALRLPIELFKLPSQLWQQDSGASAATTLLAAFHAYVARTSSQEDVTLGVQPSLLLGQASPAQQQQQYLVPLCCPIVGPHATLSSHAHQLHEQLQLLLPHSNMPLQAICTAAGIQPASSMQHPLFQAGVAVGSSLAAAAEAAAGLDLVLLIVQQQQQQQQQPVVYLLYNSGLFTQEGASLMAQHFQVYLAGALQVDSGSSAQPPLLSTPLMDAAEQQLVLEGFNATDLEYDRQTFVHGQFMQRAKEAPNAPCVVYEDFVFTYAEIDAASNRIANYLRDSAGVTPGTIVAVLVLRSPLMVATLLGVLKAGAGYLPLDHHHPDGRIAFMLEDAAVKTVVVQPDLMQKLPDAATLSSLGIHTLLLQPTVPYITRGQHPEAARGKAIPPLVPATLAPASLGAAAAASPDWEHGQLGTPDTTCYIIYTSGSTGKPKGVVVIHQGLTAYVSWFKTFFGISSTDVFMQKTPTNFDASIDELWTSLSTGAPLVVAPPEAHRDVHSVMMLVERHSVTTSSAVPSQLQALAREVLVLHGAEAAAAGCAPCSSLKRVLSGGEALTTTMAQDISTAMPRCKLFNTYGPTETTVGITAWLYEPPAADSASDAAHLAATIPIGNGIYNSRLYVLDADFKPVPIGIPGELWISGVQVTAGYLNRPDLNETTFVPNPFCEGPGTYTNRMYKCGDLVRWLPGKHACLEFLGRVDHQVKLRGFRIELQEIEAALGSLSGVSQVATALAKNPTTQQDQLVAWVSPAGLDAQDLVQQLQGMLPEYMIPTAVVRMQQLPLLPSEKVNRKALPEPDFSKDAVRLPVKTPAKTAAVGAVAAVPASAAVANNNSHSSSCELTYSSSSSSSPRGSSSSSPKRNPLMTFITEVWSDVLGVSGQSIEPMSDFFALGGNSLLCGKMNSRIRTGLNMPSLSGMLIYQNTTLGEFVTAVAGAGPGLPAGYSSMTVSTAGSSSPGSVISIDDDVSSPAHSSSTLSDLQQFIAEAWGEAVGCAPSAIGDDSDFFALGGNSLMCGKMNSRLRVGLSIPSLSGMLIYQHTTLESFTHAVAQVGPSLPGGSSSSSSSRTAHSCSAASTSFRIGAPRNLPRYPSGVSSVSGFSGVSSFSGFASSQPGSHSASATAGAASAAAAAAFVHKHPVAAAAAAAPDGDWTLSSYEASMAAASQAAYAAAAAAYSTVMATLGLTGGLDPAVSKKAAAFDLNSSGLFNKQFRMGMGSAGGSVVPVYDAQIHSMPGVPALMTGLGLGSAVGVKGGVKPEMADKAAAAGSQVQPSVWLCTLVQIVGMLVISGTMHAISVAPMLAWMWLLAAWGYKAFALLPVLNLFGLVLGVGMTILGKWLFIGRYKEGEHPIWGWHYIRHWLANQFVVGARCSFLPLIKRTTLVNFFYRALGMKIGNNVLIDTDDFLGYDLINVKDDAVLDMFCGVTAVTYEAGKPTDKFPTGKMTIKRASVGKGAVVGSHGMVVCTNVADGAVVQPCTASNNPAAAWKGAKWPQSGPDGITAAKSQDRPLGLLSGLLALVITDLVMALLTFPFMMGFLLFWCRLSGYSLGELPVVAADTLSCFTQLPSNPLSVEAAAKCDNLLYASLKSMLLYPTAIFIIGQLLVLLLIPYKWLVRGRIKPDAALTLNPGPKPWGERFRSHLLQVMLDHPGLKMYLYMWTGTAVFNAWLRAMGTKVGRQAWIGEGLQLFEHDLVEIGDGVSVCSEVSLMPSTVMGSRKIIIRGGSDVTNQTCLYPGVSVMPGACLGVFTYAEAERTFPRDSIVQGPMVLMPGKPEPEDGGPAVQSDPGATRQVSSWQYFKFNAFYSLLMVVLLPLTVQFSTLPFYCAMMVLVFKQGLLWSVLLMPAAWGIDLATDVLWMMLVKKVLLRRCTGNNPFYQYTHTAWMITGILFYFHQTSLLKYLSGSQLAVWYYRAMGAEIGKGVLLNSLASNEPDCLIIGDGTVIDDLSFVMAHTTENRCVKFHDVHIGSRVTIGCGSAVMPGCVISDDAVIGDVSIVMKGETVPCGAVWRGVPAVPVMDHV